MKRNKKNQKEKKISGIKEGIYEVTVRLSVEQYNKVAEDAAFFGVDTIGCLNLLIGNSIDDLHIMADAERKVHGEKFSPSADCSDCFSGLSTQ